VVFVPVPHDILERLHPAPTGYKYVRVDSDVLLIGEASKKIIDVVTLLSGVGR
jgi:Ni/Co efflux regulator RcnB